MEALGEGCLSGGQLAWSWTLGAEGAALAQSRPVCSTRDGQRVWTPPLESPPALDPPQEFLHPPPRNSPEFRGGPVSIMASVELSRG